MTAAFWYRFVYRTRTLLQNTPPFCLSPITENANCRDFWHYFPNHLWSIPTSQQINFISHGSLWDSSLVKQFIYPWSRDTLLMAVRKVSSPAFKIYYFMGKQQEGKKAATEPPPDFCPVSILSNKIIYLAAFRKWYTGHLKYTHNIVSLSQSAAPATGQPSPFSAGSLPVLPPDVWMGQIILLLRATSSISIFFNPKLFGKGLVSLSLFLTGGNKKISKFIRVIRHYHVIYKQ